MPLAERPTVLVTGASAGLGLELGKRLIARDRYRLVLTAREGSLPRFSEAGIREADHVMLWPLDVVREQEREAVVEEVERRWGGVDVLVNNAGVAYRAVVEHVSEAEFMAQMTVNYEAPMDLARLCLPHMRARRRGRIINVSSVGGMMAMPTMAIYSASKFALEGATEALWYEVRPWNVRVSLIQPGFINSRGFRNTVYTEESRFSADHPGSPYALHYRHMSGFISRMMGRVGAPQSSVAKKIIKTIERRNPPLRVPATLDARLFGLMRRFLPRRLYHWILYRSLPDVSAWGRNHD
jgi:NAD(P)-dependent dehydrogenase (short-subunit alcohol dehydrogenase family)